MATLNIQGREVTVDDAFLELTPEEQNAQVDEIARSLGLQPQQQQQGVLGAIGGAFGTMRDIVTGAPQRTPETRALPELTGTGFGLDPAQQAQVAGMSLLTPNPDELAQVLTSNYPFIQTRKDAKGNVIATNTRTGEQAVLNQPGLSMQDITSFIGQALAFTPAARLGTIGGVAAGSAATQAAMEAAQTALGGTPDVVEVPLAGAIGGLGKGVEEGVSAIARGVQGRIAPEAQAVIEAGRREGVPVMTSDILPPETFAQRTFQQTAEKLPFVGTGPRRATQQTARKAALDRFIEGVEPQYETIVSSLKASVNKERRAAGGVLETFATRLEPVGDIATENTIKKLDESIAFLSRERDVPDAALLEKLGEYRDAVARGQTYSDLNTLRSGFRRRVKGDRVVALADPDQKRVDDIYDAMTADMRTAVKQNLGPDELKSWNRANRIYSFESERIKKTGLKRVLETGDVTPENVRTVLLSQKPSVVKSLYKSLNEEGRAAGRVTIISDIVSTLGARQTGITPSAFATEAIKKKAAIDAFFKKEDRNQLRGFIKLLDATRRGQEAAVLTPTGQQLMGAAGASGIYAAPLETVLGVGSLSAMAHVYESPAVRNALLRVASIPKGSTRYDMVIREAGAAIRTAALSARQSGVGGEL